MKHDALPQHEVMSKKKKPGSYKGMSLVPVFVKPRARHSTERLSKVSQLVDFLKAKNLDIETKDDDYHTTFPPVTFNPYVIGTQKPSETSGETAREESFRQPTSPSSPTRGSLADFLNADPQSLSSQQENDVFKLDHKNDSMEAISSTFKDEKKKKMITRKIAAVDLGLSNDYDLKELQKAIKKWKTEGNENSGGQTRSQDRGRRSYVGQRSRSKSGDKRSQKRTMRRSRSQPNQSRDLEECAKVQCKEQKHDHWEPFENNDGTLQQSW